MRRYKDCAGILFMICFCLLVIGCEKSSGGSDRHLLMDKAKCIFCGDGEDSFRSRYSGHPGVGLFCLGDQRMVEIQPFVEEIKGDITSHVWADTYSVQVDRMIDRGISLVQYISGEKDRLDLDGLCESLCSECIKNVEGSVKIYGKEKKHKERAVCLVDLSTMELYGVQQSFQYYILDDYYVQASCQEDKIRLTVFQTSRVPEKL